MITFIVSYLLSSLILFSLILLGEYYSNKKPNSKFNIWWNKHIITKISKEEEDYYD